MEAAAAASADQLASMKREIAELEAQMGKAQRQKSTVFLDVASLGPTQQLLVCGESVHVSTRGLCPCLCTFRTFHMFGLKALSHRRAQVVCA